MGKGKRLRAKRKRDEFYSRAEEVLTRNFQKEIRNSPMWAEMVAQFGEKKAEELLRQCKGELRGPGESHASGNSPTDI